MKLGLHLMKLRLNLVHQKGNKLLDTGVITKTLASDVITSLLEKR